MHLRLRDVGDGFGLALTQFGKMDALLTTTNYSMKILGDTVFSIGDKMYKSQHQHRQISEAFFFEPEF